MTFKDFNLSDALLRALEERGYTTPTEIQSQAIPFLIQNNADLVAQAQTGTGKTAAFALPLISKMDPNSDEVQALILTPTRELANQINEEMEKFGVYSNVRSFSVYGGVPLDPQIRNFRRVRPQIVVGTPGRVIDLVERKVLKLSKAMVAVLDEADEMLNMGFIDDVKYILDQFDESHKTWMFSATMPGPILDLIREYLEKPHTIQVKKKTMTNENIDQKYFIIQPKYMVEALCRLIESVDNFYAMIFCNTKVEAKEVADELNFRGFSADSLHGDMSQQQRDMTMKNFKEKKVNLLICTDVAARGIDVDNLTHVFNFSLPQDMESYVHRIGRTGRAGAKGIAYLLIAPAEKRRLGYLEKLTRSRLDKGELPTLEDLKGNIVKKELRKLQAKLELSEEFVCEHFEKFDEFFRDFERENLLKLMYRNIFEEKFAKYKNKESIEYADQRDPRGSDVRGEGRTPGMARFFMNVGKLQGMGLRELLELVGGAANIDQRKIRNILLKDNFSFLEVPSEYSDAVLAIRELNFNDTLVRFELTRGAGASSSDRGGDRRDGGGRGFGGRGGGRSYGGGGGGFNRGGGESRYPAPSENRYAGSGGGSRDGGFKSDRGPAREGGFRSDRGPRTDRPFSKESSGDGGGNRRDFRSSRR